MASTMVSVATCTEFQSAAVTPWKLTKKDSEARSNDGQKRLGKAVTSSGAESALTSRR